MDLVNKTDLASLPQGILRVPGRCSNLTTFPANFNNNLVNNDSFAYEFTSSSQTMLRTKDIYENFPQDFSILITVKTTPGKLNITSF